MSDRERHRYRTIVADPPWQVPYNARFGGGRDGAYGLPYDTMPLSDIARLPVSCQAADDAHLWLWTTATFLFDAPAIARSWGFRPTYTLAWCKPGLGVGARFRHNTEYILFCERGAPLLVTRRDLGTHFNWRKGEHSAKPDAFYDMVETTSPGPYLELFARRARFGWDYWGDQSLGTAEMCRCERPPTQP